jgi:hypothetical protein
MQAAIWPATAPELVAAVSEASGLGSIGSVFDSAESVQRQIARVGEITPRPFAVNYVVPLLDEAAFRATLEAQPAAVSFALGDPGELVERAHNAGAKVVHQIHTVGQARKATLRGGRQVLPSRQARHSAGWRRGDADERHIRADHRRQVLATVGGPAPIVLVLNNRDLNFVTWEQRVTEATPSSRPPRIFPTFHTPAGRRCCDSKG